MKLLLDHKAEVNPKDYDGRTALSSASRYGRKDIIKILMAKMPVDPRLSRMFIEAEKEGCLEEVCIIASALSIRDPRERPAEKTEEADRMHATFRDPASDFVTLLNIWNRYHDVMAAERGLGSVRRF